MIHQGNRLTTIRAKGRRPERHPRYCQNWKQTSQIWPQQRRWIQLYQQQFSIRISQNSFSLISRSESLCHKIVFTVAKECESLKLLNKTKQNDLNNL